MRDTVVMRRAFPSIAILGVLLAACAGQPQPPAGSPTGPPSSAGPAGTAAPGTSAAPGGTSAPGPATTPPPGGLALDSIVTPTVELNVRQEPGLAGSRLGMIAAGSQSFLVDGPREADGYSWYLVSGIGIPPASGCTTPIETEPFNCPMWFGWVASASLEGVPWLTVDDAECPAEAPYEAEAYNIGKPPLLLLHCYGGDTLRLRAWLPDQEAPPCTGQDSVPWLACPAVTLGWGEDYPSGLAAAVDPASGVTLPATNQWVEITGHMDHPSATECRPFPEQPAGQAVVFCRAILILDSIAPTAAP